MLIATASSLWPALTDYKAPFFEGLMTLYLPSITAEDLSKIFQGESLTRAAGMLELAPPTIQSVGIIAQIIETIPDSEEDNQKLLSFFSSLYKMIYDSLPEYSQRILNVLGTADHKMTMPEIRALSALPSNVLTSYLKILSKKGLIKCDKSAVKRTLYAVKDPLFRLWLNQIAK
ncbi:MAG: hypothetical protein LIP03_01265 [Bacteroidales bacterium]|nr:hypothetical protein [Bacteroidales bacterium]